MAVESYLAVLKNRQFAKLWVSQITSQLTNYILSFAILIKVFKLTDSSLSVSLIIMVFGLATVFFGSLAGVFADRFDRKWVLTITNFAQAATIALYFAVGADLLGLLLITFIYSSLNQFYIAAEAPSIPDLVDKSQILIANSYFAFTNSAALIIGFAGAGPMSSAFGQAAPFTAGVLLLVVAGIVTLSLPSIKTEGRILEASPFAKIWHEFKEGLEHFWVNAELHYPLISLVLVQIINGMLITIAPAFMQKTIGIDLDTGSILVVAPIGIGILIGALSLGFEEKYFSRKSLVFAGFVGMGLMLFGISFVQHFANRLLYYSFFALFMGYFNAHIFAPSHSLLQTFSLSSLRGRIYATLYVSLQVAATIPTFIVGILADKFPLNYIAAGLGITLLVFGFLTKPAESFFRR